MEEDSVRFSESKLSKSVFARLYLQYDCDRYFPEYGWDDFAEIVLEWWMNSAASLIKYGGSSIFRFMDGGFSFEIVVDNNGNFHVELRENLETTLIQDVDFMGFCQSLMAASNLLIRRMQEISKDRDISSPLVLQQNVLRNLLKKLKSSS